MLTSNLTEQGLLEKLKDVELMVPKGLTKIPWIEHMSISTQETGFTTAHPEEPDVEEGTKRESYLHDGALGAVQEGYRRLHALGVPASRPADFLAEMLKTDHHMLKVKQRLLYEQKKVEKVETRKRKLNEKKQTEKKEKKKGQEDSKTQKVPKKIGGKPKSAPKKSGRPQSKQARLNKSKKAK